MNDSSVFLMECPRFLGGTRSVQHMARADCDQESLRFDAESIRGIRFTDAPREVNCLAAGDWKVHIDSYEIDMLADAYLNLEDVAIDPAF